MVCYTTPEATTFLGIGAHLKYLLCFLNSTLSNIFVKHGTTTGMGTLRWKKYLIELLPIPKANPETEKRLERLLDLLLAESGSEKQTEISLVNNIIYELFGFTDDEIAFIESMVLTGAHWLALFYHLFIVSSGIQELED